jgi:hypothetical protein
VGAKQLIAIVLTALAAVECNERNPIPEAVPVAPSQPPATPTPSPPVVPPPPAPLPAPLPLTIASFTLRQSTLFAGTGTTGTLVISRPAPEGGVAINLSNGDPSAATLPVSVTLVQGAERISFPIGTQSVSSDRQVGITASATGTSATVRLAVWSPLTGPTNVLRFASEPGDYVGAGQTKRIDAGPNAVFSGDMWGDNNYLSLSVRTPDYKSWWSLLMGASAGQPLAPGVYRNTRRIPLIGSSNPRLDFAGDGRGCNESTGEFEVFEAVYGPKPARSGTSGTIDRFRARFSQVCDGEPAGLIGEVFVASIPATCKTTGNC